MLPPLSRIRTTHQVNAERTASNATRDTATRGHRVQATASHEGRTRGWRDWSFGRPISTKGLAVFTRQLAILVRAGLPILRSLEVLTRQVSNPAFRRLLEQIGDTIRSGRNLSDGLAANERVFGRLYINMVKAGEAGGVLDVVLDRLAAFLEKTQRMKSKVQTAMIYPAIITCVATGIVSTLMLFVVPKFQDIFAGLLKGQPLPMLTQGLIGMSNFVRQQFVLAAGLFAAAAVIGRFVGRSTRGRRLLDRVVLRLPLFGDLCLKAAIARFARTFGTLMASGVPILQALAMTRETSGNIQVAEAVTVVHDRVKVGGTVAHALGSMRLFPPMVTSMIEVGEETGALPAMLNRIADAYDDEVDHVVAGLTAMIEPIMIVLMALAVGLIVVALFLPLVGIIQHL
jgi:type IV pilus assembly protein PilC